MEPMRTYPSFRELCEIVGTIAQKHGVGHVYLFGSRARGDFNDDSDYDFCIELGKIRSLLQLSRFKIDLEDALGAGVDVVDENMLDKDFVDEVLNDRQLVYEA
jgi:predicted nucleotidyltransferase